MVAALGKTVASGLLVRKLRGSVSPGRQAYTFKLLTGVGLKIQP